MIAANRLLAENLREGAGGGKGWLWDMDRRREESSSPRGQKRHADDNLEGEQRLSKRFNLLNLEQNGKLYIPVQDNVRSSAPAASAQIDSMQLDDTKDKVYIHNLDAELADLESDEETPVFLPDVEKKLSKIPRSVLTGRSPPITSTQLILYNVPSSLSVPEEQDSVRRAIIESRARTRAKQAQQQKAGEEHNLVTGNLGNGIRHDSDKDGTANDEDMEVDENAMEIG